MHHGTSQAQKFLSAHATQFAVLGTGIIGGAAILLQQTVLATSAFALCTTASMVDRRRLLQSAEKQSSAAKQAIVMLDAKCSVLHESLETLSQSAQTSQQADKSASDPETKAITRQHLTPLNNKIQEFHLQFRKIENRLNDLESQVLQEHDKADDSENVESQIEQPLKDIEQEKTCKVAMFIDSANIEIAARQLDISIDYPKLVSSRIDQDKLAEVKFYIGTNSFNPSQKNFLNFLRSNDFKIVSKPIINRPDGTHKANFDVEIATDMRDLTDCDKVILVSGDGDFTYAVKSVQRRLGAKVEVIALRSCTSSALIQAADSYTDLESIKSEISRQKSKVA